MKKILQSILKFLAVLILKKYKPRIVGITGSVGKTSAKEAIYAVLAPKFRTGKNLKNYNNEIGLPLSIIGSESAGRNIIGWALIFLKALSSLAARNRHYPEILILEMGIDRPGDMDYLLSIVKPKVGVVTAIGQSHLEYFKTLEKVKKEKGKLVTSLDGSCRAILNFDDENIRSLTPFIKAEIISYGISSGADVHAELKAGAGDSLDNPGLAFVLSYENESADVFLPGIIGTSAVYSILAGVSAGIAFGMDIEEITKNLAGFRLPLGRMNLIKGINGSQIIDDTYNASPQSAGAALEAVAGIKIHEGAKKIAIFGDMLELGGYEIEGHQYAGRKCAEAKIDELLLVGEKAKLIGMGAEAAGIDGDKIHYFKDIDEAVAFAVKLAKENDLILIKGSQGARMEKATKALMAEPSRAEDLLVRQGKEWTNK